MAERNATGADEVVTIGKLHDVLGEIVVRLDRMEQEIRNAREQFNTLYLKFHILEEKMKELEGEFK